VEISRDVNNQAGSIGLIDSSQAALSIKPISRFFPEILDQSSQAEEFCRSITQLG
jgi:hypothetical protein